MVTITFTGTVAEIKKQMLEVIAMDMRTTAPIHVGVDLAMPGADKTVTTAMPEPEKKTRTRRTKEQIAADKAQEEIQTKQHDTRAEDPVKMADESPAALQSDKPAGAPVVNKEAVHAALQQVNVAVGLPKAREILTHFKVNRMSELKPEDFKPFIEKCNEAVMMA